ncbi:MAG: hypothetical protein JKY55_20415 [Aliivibrio sp.]|uniref:hypothetical protein n=1 Tax=Aliivibrio sp. TaxID=1872443 RepID=UPI001A3B78E9|nr:hypothetical protein [Aliivibrio sp.]
MLKPEHDTLPPLSRFEVKFPLQQKWGYGTVRKNTGIIYNLQTSAGDVREKFPKDWAHILYMALEQNQEGLASEQ